MFPAVDPDALTVVIARALGAEILPVHASARAATGRRPASLGARAFLRRPDADGARLVAELGTRPRGVRPAELAQVMGIELGLARRTNQWIERDGSRWEPLTATRGSAAVWERAS